MSEGVRGVVIGHSSLGEGMVAAVRKITGVSEDALSSLSNEGRGPDTLLEAIRDRAGDDSVILFTDMAGGSCAFAARKTAALRASTAHVAGVNLPLLLDFVFHRELPLTELVKRLVECGRAGITGTCTEETAHADHTAPD
jgi:mannose/fructose-specific phosphotransferase system component IIA